MGHVKKKHISKKRNQSMIILNGSGKFMNKQGKKFVDLDKQVMHNGS